MATQERRGLRQIFQALRYSLKGLRAAWRHEASFRLEVWTLLPALPLGFYLGQTGVERALLMSVLLLVPAMELMNSGLEAIVDKTTPEHHELAGRAKDMGSAATFLCMLIVLLVWSMILLPRVIAFFQGSTP
jgi:diacylglycerol kinase (ATP)